MTPLTQHIILLIIPCFVCADSIHIDKMRPSESSQILTEYQQVERVCAHTHGAQTAIKERRNESETTKFKF